jgi:hypothetical protein
VYINVIYFFAMHEICVHTIFEPSTKKIPSLLFMFRKEKNPYIEKPLYHIVVDKKFPRKIVIAECLLRALAHFHSSCNCRRFASCSILAIDAT